MQPILRFAASALVVAAMSIALPGTAQAATPKWSSISAGESHTCGIRTNGALYCWGDNGDGQLGLGDNTDRNTPRKITG